MEMQDNVAAMFTVTVVAKRSIIVKRMNFSVIILRAVLSLEVNLVMR